MKQSISTHQTSNNAGDNGLNGLDKHTQYNFTARKKTPPSHAHIATNSLVDELQILVEELSDQLTL